MADQILTSNESYPGAGGAGIGAVIFGEDKTAQENLDGAITNANDLLAQRRKAQVAALANSQVIMKGLNLKPDGARPQDIDGEGGLAARAQAIYDKQSTIYGAFNGNLSSPQAQMLQLQNITKPQVQFEADVQRSKGLAKIQMDANNEIKLHPNDYDMDYYNQGTATLAAMHLNNPALDNWSISNLLKHKPTDGETLIANYAKTLKNMSPKGVQTTEYNPAGTTSPPGFEVERTNTENFSQNAITHFGDNYRLMTAMQQAMDSDWEKIKQETPGVIGGFAQKYMYNPDGTPNGVSKVQAEMLAERDWVMGRLEQGYHESSHTDKYIESIQSKKDVAAVKAGDADEKNVNYGVAAQIGNTMHGDTAAINSFQTVHLKPFDIPQLDDNGKPKIDENTGKVLPPIGGANGIEAMEPLSGGGVKYQTTQTRYEDSKNGKPAGSTWIVSGKYDGRAFYQFMRGDNVSAAEMNQIDKAHVRMNAEIPDGPNRGKWDPDVFALNNARRVAGKPILSYNDALAEYNKPAATSKSTTTKTAQSGKTVSAATIKSLVGTKGYEGYTEDMLRDYYTKNGYTVK